MSAEDQPQAAAEELIETPEVAESVDNATDPTDPAATGSAPRRAADWLRRRWVAALMVAVVLASAGAAGAVYWWVYRPDRMVNAAAQDQALAAARQATEALLSYSPESIDKNVADAKSHLTGEFLARYSNFVDTVVVPAAKERGVKTEANVAKLAVSQMRPDSAEVLAFVNQVTTSRDRPTPALATSSVLMTLVRNGDTWLVSQFDPI